jgi:hypothetical protein
MLNDLEDRGIVREYTSLLNWLRQNMKDLTDDEVSYYLNKILDNIEQQHKNKNKSTWWIYNLRRVIKMIMYLKNKEKK